MEIYAIDPGAFSGVLARAVRGGADVVQPALVGERWTWKKAVPEELDAGPVDLGPARAGGPAKAHFLPPRGEVSRFFGEDAPRESRGRIVVGVRQCDLAALRVLDHVFLEGEFTDPFYAARREGTLVVSADCTAPYDVCFCTLVEGGPHPTRGFDLNLSLVGDALVVEVGSGAGERFVGENRAGFRKAYDHEVAARDAARGKVIAALDARLGRDLSGFPGDVRRVTRGREDHGVWDDRAADCVECGACNFVCPTCHCFYLLDCAEERNVRRFAEWDSCLYPKFARVAGGANPRARRAERLLNRFEKKFTYFPDVMDALACTGCGRCVEACAGKIDMREVLKELVR